MWATRAIQAGGACTESFRRRRLRVERDAYPQALSGLPEKLSPTATNASLLPDAAAMIKLGLPEIQAGRTLNAAQVAPIYLRNQIATPVDST